MADENSNLQAEMTPEQIEAARDARLKVPAFQRREETTEATRISHKVAEKHGGVHSTLNPFPDTKLKGNHPYHPTRPMTSSETNQQAQEETVAHENIHKILKARHVPIE